MSETETRHCDGCGEDYSVADERHDWGSNAHLLTKTDGVGGMYTIVTPTLTDDERSDAEERKMPQVNPEAVAQISRAFEGFRRGSASAALR